ncbi:MULTISPECIES: flagellar basal-body MS-ring/collar protein FliF [unclassified Nitratiruptor]|uniref:flagellar basal-body MS-ring/collar protein FliF n=1 Tax=unclassified Nitratiruptor TaxID=2624044 RepID=UPI001915911B|nr:MULTISPECIES: flagellar basal-body MS-ring/collar protein FliF [unclassified Nitratiruptor]BCD59924.1 flagellar M-ring protein FliF [Nitratiruptor sp. YY08-10]BCD63847.1 flagellar M-ring protein FliF [Nitratiruptor sp. YY08-14]
MALDIATIKEKLKQAFENKNFIKTLFLALGIGALIVLLSALLIRDISAEKYGVLYANLTADDAGNILTILQEEKIPYKVEGNGKIILVPKDKIYDVRLKLAAKGLPRSQNVGFEIFDEPKMGITHFQENINYIRALEGELARTIKKIDAVQDARVNIALSKDSIFAREEDEAKASVIISLHPGMSLTKEQVKAIVFLVSHAVPKLKPQNVTVVDNTGRVLSDMLEENEEKEINDVVDLKRKLRRDIEKSVESMLARALGAQKVVVRANVEIETAKIDKRDEIYDPDKTAVVSERKIQEKSKSVPQRPVGSPGTPTNVPATINTGPNGNILQDKSKKDITTNYDVTKSLIVTKQNVFKVKKITVGVLIDGKYIKKMDKNGTMQVQFVPRSEQELKSFENLIKSAIGYDPKRGDQVTVVSVPFENQALAAPIQPSKGFERYIIYAAFALIAIMALLLVWFILKQRKQKVLLEQELATVAQPGTTTPQSLTESSKKALHELEEEMSALSLQDEPVYQKILHIAQENPDLIATLISKWIKEEASSK